MMFEREKDAADIKRRKNKIFDGPRWNKYNIKLLFQDVFNAHCGMFFAFVLTKKVAHKNLL